jgi:hypothetical protein
VARVRGPGAPTRLSLLDGQGRLLVQSHGRSAGDRSDVVASVGHYPEGVRSLAVFLGNGRGGFLPPTVIGLGVFSIPDVVVGDFTGRGRDDIAVSGIDPSGRTVVRIFMNQGGGTFTPGPTVVLGDAYPDNLLAGDFNGDGRDDLAVVQSGDPGGSTLTVLLGGGDGTFRAQPAVALGDLSPFSVTTDDFNKDGRADIAVAGVDSSDVGNVVVLLNQGGGAFRALPPVVLGTMTPFDLMAGDVDRDGRTELIASGFNGTTSQVEVLPGNGDGTFRALKPGVIKPVISGPFFGTLGASLEVVGDFNGDGRPDVAIFGNTSTVQVLLGAGDGTFRAGPSVTLGTFDPLDGLFFVAGDFNGDGRHDLAVVTDTDLIAGAASAVVVLQGAGNGRFLAPVASTLADPQVPTLAADVFGDGRDVLVSHPGGTDVATAFGLGGGRFVPLAGVATTVHDTPHVAALGGTDDVFVVDRGGRILWRPGRPGDPGAFGPPVTINPDDPARDIALVPAPGGLVVAGVDVHDDGVSLYQYRGGRFVKLPGTLATGVLPTQVVAADLNGDGNGDLAVRDAGDGTVTVFLGDGGGGFTRRAVLDVGLGASSIALVPRDGSGPPDLVVTDQNAGAVRIYPGRGDGTFGAPSVYQAGTGPYGLAGGGSTDLTSQEATAGAAVGTAT